MQTRHNLLIDFLPHRFEQFRKLEIETDLIRIYDCE